MATAWMQEIGLRRRSFWCASVEELFSHERCVSRRSAHPNLYAKIYLRGEITKIKSTLRHYFSA